MLSRFYYRIGPLALSMRLKKQKCHRKAVRFYTACFGFREPFKVLCVLAELRSLGNSYVESLNAARNLLIARCDHEKRKSAVSCITDVIGEKNSEHFFVATQDADSRGFSWTRSSTYKYRVFLLYMVFEMPYFLNSHQLCNTSSSNLLKKTVLMTKLEYKLLNVKMENVASEEVKDSSDANEGKEDHTFGFQAMQTNIRKKKGDLNDKVQFKRKRAKGPNPLSCLKKKQHGSTNKAASEKVVFVCKILDCILSLSLINSFATC
ncbi:hypothetical protein ACH5RR_006446 [Cinchona calisaya]|uniref:UTP23 sensor motif region domain-containing protein n=1 Tax=Cinchona calisaya TaxID=153742 RepID=A0ABD3AP13_9GENT